MTWTDVMDDDFVSVSSSTSSATATGCKPAPALTATDHLHDLLTRPRLFEYNVADDDELDLTAGSLF